LGPVHGAPNIEDAKDLVKHALSLDGEKSSQAETRTDERVQGGRGKIEN